MGEEKEFFTRRGIQNKRKGMKKEKCGRKMCIFIFCSGTFIFTTTMGAIYLGLSIKASDLEKYADIDDSERYSYPLYDSCSYPMYDASSYPEEAATALEDLN